MNKSQIFRKRIINTYTAMQHMVKDFKELVKDDILEELHKELIK